MASGLNHRTAILGSIRRSLTSVAPALSEAQIADEYAAMKRRYTTAGRLEAEPRIELFEDRLREYDAGVYHASKGDISSVVAEIMTEREKRSLAIPAGLDVGWLPEGFVFQDAQGFDAYQLDMTEGLLSGCTVAIAETGTIVLQSVAAQGPRILSLVPDYHLCVVFASQIVETVPEAFERLKATSTLPTTFISGPSATADIEMTRIKGVHGPRSLDVLMVEDS